MQLNGFTLIEVLVVISIIGILASFILPNLLGARQRAADAKTKNNMAQFKGALRLYYNENQTYPDVAVETSCSAGAITTALAPFLDADVIPASCMYIDEDSGNGFSAYVPLATSAGTEDTQSASLCGKTPVEQRYYVCAK